MHLLTLVLATAALTLPEARRASDRAFRTELAGDHEGAIRAVRALLEASSDPAEASARIHLEDFLKGLERRRAALAEGIQGDQGAMATLRDAPAAWRDLYWSALVARRPDYQARLNGARIELQLARVHGIAPREIEAEVARSLETLGAQRVEDEGTHRLRLDLDAREQAEVRHRVRAKAQGAFVLTELAGPSSPVSGFVEVQSERADGRRARRLADRRLVGELMEGVGFELRLWALGLSRRADVPEPP
ncbi:MAG: hypothetical protein AAGD10_01930 [Myxococcota bacterium]